VITAQRSENPLVPLSIFRVTGLAAADVTQLIGLAGFLSLGKAGVRALTVLLAREFGPSGIHVRRSRLAAR
jgi:hypothetical protein